MLDVPAFLRPAVTWLEGQLVRRRVPPDALTWTSLALALLASAAFAWGELAIGGALLWGSGVLDLLDGRVARASGSASPRGALLDSTCDRWAELFVFGGLALHEAPDVRRLALVLAALAGSLMVSYTRARGEALGVTMARVGLAQRAERILILGAGAILGERVLMLALLLVAVLATATAIVRLRFGMRALAQRAAPPVRSVPAAVNSSRPLPS